MLGFGVRVCAFTCSFWRSRRVRLSSSQPQLIFLRKSLTDPAPSEAFFLFGCLFPSALPFSREANLLPFFSTGWMCLTIPAFLSSFTSFRQPLPPFLFSAGKCLIQGAALNLPNHTMYEGRISGPLQLAHTQETHHTQIDITEGRMCRGLQLTSLKDSASREKGEKNF